MAQDRKTKAAIEIEYTLIQGNTMDDLRIKTFENIRVPVSLNSTKDDARDLGRIRYQPGT
jgi:hypothetical protein